MENTNSATSKLIKEAEAKGKQVIVISPSANRVEEIKRIMEKAPKDAIIIIDDITDLELKEIGNLEMVNKPKHSPFEPEPFVIKSPPILPEITLDIYKIDSKPFTGLRRKKFKGYQR